MSKKALVVEDDVNIAELLMLYLEKDGFEVSIAHDGGRGIEMFNETSPDLVLLDVMMPVMDGMQVCREIRKTSSVPIIMLTAKGEDTDKLLGFEYGADDYISKPFNVLELKARIRAILRRSASRNTKSENETRVDGGAIVLELSERLAYVGERPVDLTPKEFDLLELLMRSPNCVFSRESLLNTVWGYDYPGDIRTVDVHIRRLREKLEDNPAQPEYV